MKGTDPKYFGFSCVARSTSVGFEPASFFWKQYIRSRITIKLKET